ncbi:hypothetical protein KBD20_03155 [Candidatus Saccharibacteria bacterium]|nr:hypothetical protein [Candidatus Saccharibacteria bacterium]
MAKKTKPNQSKTASTSAKTKKITQTAPKTVKRAPNVRVKSVSDVITTVQNQITYNLHDRHSFAFKKKTRTKLVAYGPWLSILSVIVISPQLLNLAKNGSLLSVSGFFNEIFFNQDSWVILVIILLNTLLLVDGLSDLFVKSKRGWDRVYLPALITAVYVAYQLLGNLSQPAAPLLSLLGACFVLFTILDVREFYTSK